MHNLHYTIFYKRTNILQDFHICISVPSSFFIYTEIVLTLSLIHTKQKPDWIIIFEHLLELNSQKHESQCMYRSHKCDYCKQLLILNKHDKNCPEMPETCFQCYNRVMRKNLQEVLNLCLHFLFI